MRVKILRLYYQILIGFTRMGIPKRAQARPIPTDDTCRYQVPALTVPFIGKKTVRTGLNPVRCICVSKLRRIQCLTRDVRKMVVFSCVQFSYHQQLFNQNTCLLRNLNQPKYHQPHSPNSYSTDRYPTNTSSDRVIGCCRYRQWLLAYI